MSQSTKIELVRSVQNEYSLTAALEAVELPKSSWYYAQQKLSYSDKYAHLRSLLEQIIRQHPDYGILRLTHELQQTYQQAVNHKVIQRLLKLWNLSLLRSTQPPPASPIRQTILVAGDRANRVAQLRDIRLFEVAYTDFTELRFAGGQRKAYLMPIVAHTCKLVYGWAVGLQANTALALQAWQRAKQTFRRYQIPYQGMIIHHDQDPVYTSDAWTYQLLVKDQVQLSYALSGAKDNPQMESFNARFKTEGHSLFMEASDLAQLQAVVKQQIRYYNTQRRHSSLDYLAPLTYLIKVWPKAAA
jgi:putative transposase